jgi:ABC transporter substrate binding protein
MVTIGGTVPAQAAKSATTDIPIVVAIGSDPVKNGLVTNLYRPGGNVTAVTFFPQEFKRTDFSGAGNECCLERPDAGNLSPGYVASGKAS